MVTLLLHLLRLLPILCGGHRQVALENLALRQQLAVYKRTVSRPKLRTTDRLFWAALARVWAGWRQPLLIVTPDTVLRWQRRRFREHWARLSARPAGGRPSVNAGIRSLVTRIATANPLWGAPRIHGELLKLGIDIAERTVSRLLQKRRIPPSQTWRTFLTNHVRDLVSLDFFTVPTARLRVFFVLVVLAHHRRRILHFNVTEHPTAAWTAQQVVETFPDDSVPSYLLRDRDNVYGHAFRRRVKGMGILEVLTAPKAHGRIPSPSASSAPSGASVWTTSSSSARAICAAFCPATSRTTTVRDLISRSTKTHPTDGPSSGRSSAWSSRFQKSVACIIATSGRRLDLDLPNRRPPPPPYARSSLFVWSLSSDLVAPLSGGVLEDADCPA